jgi:Short C-terminal domain/Phospholipase_D-nuclease N-terminal
MSSYPLLDAFLTIAWFFALLLWIFLVVWIILDVFRNRDIRGWSKAGWILLVILLPVIGVLVYVGVHGDMLQDRREREILARDAAFRAGGTTTTFELAKLTDLHSRGVITDAEFEQRKEEIQG